MASTHKDRSLCCFKEWMHLQEQELQELLQALNQNRDNDTNSENDYIQLAQTGINHFHQYINKRSQIIQEDPSAYIAPLWCTSLEISSLWIGGCRPSSFVRLIYALAGSNIETIIAELMQGTSGQHVRELTSKQMAMINNLHLKTINEEDKMTSKLASLQEDVADQPISVVAKGLSQIGEPNGEVERALDERDRAIANLIDEADRLRLNTLKELIHIVNPLQAVEFLAAAKKLHLCIHEWGKRRDHKHGRDSAD